MIEELGKQIAAKLNQTRNPGNVNAIMEDIWPVLEAAQLEHGGGTLREALQAVIAADDIGLGTQMDAKFAEAFQKAARLAQAALTQPKHEGLPAPRLDKQQFDAIYARVQEDLKDLIEWRPEIIARVTMEETLVELTLAAQPKGVQAQISDAAPIGDSDPNRTAVRRPASEPKGPDAPGQPAKEYK
jgi:hypothetical protein